MPPFGGKLVLYLIELFPFELLSGMISLPTYFCTNTLLTLQIVLLNLLPPHLSWGTIGALQHNL